MIHIIKNSKRCNTCNSIKILWRECNITPMHEEEFENSKDAIKRFTELLDNEVDYVNLLVDEG